MQAPVKINGRRFMETIHSTCEFGKAHRYGEHETETGMARLALNDDDKKVREWLIQQVKAVGCSVTIDQMGNIFAVRPGRNKTAPPVMMGSHLDTQPTGGRYDGILGVLAALEALRTIHESGYQTEGPIGLVNWTNEEGARFPMVTVSSGVWADVVPLETAWNCREVASLSQGPELKTMKQELARIGFLGETPASYKAFPIGAHFELHIEQGPILENEEQKIGVVTAAQAYSWFEITVKGQDCHAGTTPLSARSDPLLAAAKMIAASNQIAKIASGLITTGIFQATPGSINTMAHTIKFTMDIRHPQDEQVSTMVQQCHEAFEKIATEDSERGVEVSWETLTENVAVKFHPDCISAVESAAEAVCASLPATQECRYGINPATGEASEPVPISTSDDVEMAMAAAQKASMTWGKVPFVERRRSLLAFCNAIESHRDKFASLLTREQGKPISLAGLEVTNALRWLRAFTECDLQDTTIKEDGHRKIVCRYTPLGVSVGIIPWNYPFALACAKLGPAVLAGNPMIMKPSPFTPYTCLKLSELAQDFFPPGVVQALSDDDRLGPWLTSHPIPEKISFTGSTVTGKKVLEAAASTMKRVTLELGGNDPAIICADVDIEQTAKKVTNLSFLNSGQICLAIKRIYVHESIHDQLLEAMVKHVKTLKVGEGNEEGVFMGPRQSRELDHRHSFFHGQRPPRIFHHIDRPADNSRIVTEEPFGPIVPLLTWTHEDDVIRRANDTRMGLGASVWSRDLKQAERISQNLEAGTVWINNHFDLDPSVPYGGHKESGMGLELGMDGLLAFCNKQFLYLDKSR
ncbi:hypothetical protein ZTR_05372 [Talaromyces verruculosus]|nr:hypothetical protein ZTR_05372 [Talaromyces verruculosus]